MLIQITNYTFNAMAKTIAFNDYVTITLIGVKSIKNITTAQTIYLPGTPEVGSVATNVFTFTASNSGMANGDVLEIWYDDPAAIVPDPIELPSIYSTRSDTYTTIANGTAVNVSTSPVKYFALQVVQTGTVTSWDVRLEGSLDGVNFTTILTHTNTTGSGEVVYIGAVTASSLYFRSRCHAITLGAGTNVVVTILGTV